MGRACTEEGVLGALRWPGTGAVAVAVAVVLLVLVTGACGGGDRSEDGGAAPAAETTTGTGSASTSTSTTAGAPSEAQPASCDPLGPAVTTGAIGDPEITEASGLAVGVRSSGALYTHNDSGDTARLFAMGLDGRPLATYELEGAAVTDVEDLGVGPGAEPGSSALYVADIGGNSAFRASVVVYRVPEPLVPPAPGGGTVPLAGASRYELPYPDGNPRDAEALLVDPVDGEVYIVTKTMSPTSEVFRFRPTPESATIPLEAAGSVTVPSPGFPLVTGGAVSADGSLVVLRTYDRVLRYQRSPGDSVQDALAGDPCVDPLAPQQQGEAVAVTGDGGTVLLTSEGRGAAIQAYTVEQGEGS